MVTLDRSAILSAGRRWDDRLDEARRLTARATDERASAWLEEWRRSVDTDDAGLFTKRLTWAGLSTEQALAMLSDSQMATRDDWWPTLSALTKACAESAHGQEPMAWLEQLDQMLPASAGDIPFAHALLPAADWAFGQALEHYPGALEYLAPAAVDRLRGHAVQRLAELASRPLAEMFTAEQSVGAALVLSLGSEASASRERYAAFCHGLARTGWVSLLDAYPVLGRLVATAIDTWTSVTAQLLRRLIDDADPLATTFSVSLPIRILDVQVGAGDTHRGGQTVGLVRLQGPSEPVTVVMKPKDMRIEAAFADVAAWFVTGDRSAPAVTVLEREGYGYASFIRHEPCEATELDAFYRSAGRLLALLHFLGTTDGHAENLIAKGLQLILIDPETLFEGRIASSQDQSDEVPVMNPLGESVLRTGLLPTWLRAGPRAAGIDVSALGVLPMGERVRRIPGWVNVNTDAMAWGWITAGEPMTLTSLPVPPGTPNPIPDHVDALVAGFAEGYRTALDPDGRDRLLAAIEGFRGVRRRLVLRATRVYAITQQRAQSPKRLRDANARGIELDRLARGALLADEPDVFWSIFGSELADLERLDIPYFDYPLGSRDLHGTDRVVPNALAEDGLAEALARVRNASEADLAWQSELIRASVGARQMRIGQGASEPDPEDVLPTADWESERRAAVCDIITRIDDTAIRDARGDVTWLSINPMGDGTRVSLGLLDVGFYSGRAGLLTFLDAAARLAPDAEVRARASRLLEETWQPMASALTGDNAYLTFRLIRDMGLGFAGAGGLLTTLTQGLDGIDPDQTRASRSRVLDAMLSGLVERDETADVIGGSAGAIRPLLALRDVDPDPRIDTLLRRMLDRLLSKQGPTGGWPSVTARMPLTGLAHGASGYALALLHAGVVLGRDDAVDAGARGLAYEHRALDLDAGNWPDYRDGIESGSFMLAWCHGAPGIALTRLRALQLLPDHPDANQWKADLRIGADTTASATTTDLDHLCCGNLGRAHVLQQIGQGLEGAEYVARSEQITGAVLRNWAATGSFRLNDFGTGSTAAYAGFMTGLPGIGMHLLAPDGSLLGLLG